MVFNFWILYSIYFTIAIAIALKLLKKPYKYPNGPYSIPFIGTPFTLKRLNEHPQKYLLANAESWGELCMLWYGSKPVLLINSPRVAREILGERSSIYSSRPEMNHFRQNLWPWRLLSTPAGSNFRFIRKLYHNYLSRPQSVAFRQYQDHESKVMLNSLLEKPALFLEDVERYTMSVIFSVVYGVRLANPEHPILREFNDLWDVMMRYFEPGTLMIDFVPGLEHLPMIFHPWLRKLTSIVNRESELIRAFINNLREAIKTSTAPECFGKFLLESQKQEGLSDLQAIHILAMLVGAGADTSASIFQGLFKLIALNPEATRKAQEELDSVVGSHRLPDWNDEGSLPYTRAFIKEVHRWNPIGSLGVPHCALKDDMFEDQFIPKGTIVFPNLAALSRSTQRYSDPHKFEPERFLDDASTAAESALQKDFMKRDHFHYGFGRRLCQGIHVAEQSLFIVISRILWGFNVRSKPGDMLDMNDKYLILLWKPKPYTVDIVSRGLEYAKTITNAAKVSRSDAMVFEDVVKFVPHS